jgi:gliding motility-associated lipoprotein GldH
MACDSDIVFEQNQSIELASWNEKNPATFEFEVKDTLTLHKFYLNVRNTEAYPYRNLIVFMELEFPNGKKSVDTVECFLADETGKWLGGGMMGSLYDNRFLLYPSPKQFPMAGRYDVKIYHAMRTPELPGIHDVGFRLTKAN